MVSALNRLRSLGSRHGILLSRPMTRFLATAAISEAGTASRLQVRCHHPLEEAEKQRGRDERQVHRQQQDHLAVLVLVDVQEHLEEVDRRDGDDRRGDLDLQAAGIELLEPREAGVVRAWSKWPTKFS